MDENSSSWSVVVASDKDEEEQDETGNETCDETVVTHNDHEAKVVQFLVSTGGLSATEACVLVQAAGLTCVADLLLLKDKSVWKEVIAAAQLKPIPAQKLKRAVQTVAAQGNEDDGAAHASKDDATNVVVVPKDQAASSKEQEDETLVDECIVIALDRSGSMGAGLDEARAFGANSEKTLVQRSRMDAVKQCFYAFRDRLESLACGQKLGLLQFDNAVDVVLPLTRDLDRFEAAVDHVKPRGATSIYSAILQACRMLQEELESNNKESSLSSTDLRVLVLTDGLNNSGATAREAWEAVRALGVVVDALLVGDMPDAQLRQMVQASGGTCFQIQSLNQGFELMEAEAVVSLRARRGGADKDPAAMMKAVDFETAELSSLTQAHQAHRVSTVPPALPNNLAPQHFVPCHMAMAQATSPISGGTLKRITKELREFVQAKNTEQQGRTQGIHLFVNRHNLYELKALMEGPRGTAYKGGVFCLDIVLPSDYPFKAPRIVFETPILHPNVSSTGGLCLDILRDQWSPRVTLMECLHVICHQLLPEPNTDDALRPALAELYFAYRQSNGADTRFWDQALAATRNDAARTVEEWQEYWNNDKNGGGEA